MPLRWQLTWTDRSDDWVGWSGKHRFARVLAYTGSGDRRWQWHLNGVDKTAGFSAVGGFADTEDEAKAAAEQAFADWLRYAGLRQAEGKRDE